MGTKTQHAGKCESCGAGTRAEHVSLCRDCALEELPGLLAAAVTPDTVARIADHPLYAVNAIEEFSAAFWRHVALEQIGVMRAEAGNG